MRVVDLVILFRTFLSRWDRYMGRFKAAWYRQKFLFLESPRHRLIELGENVVFRVPVRGGGAGTIRIGKGSFFGVPEALRGEIILEARNSEAEIVIGENAGVNNNTVLCAVQSIRIGNTCRIGDSVAIMDADFHEISPATRDRSVGVVQPVSIGNNVWIGSRVMILKGSTVGNNSVIGAMSVVTSDIPENCVAAGVPARVIRKI